jgi:hypothetical protein
MVAVVPVVEDAILLMMGAVTSATPVVVNVPFVEVAIMPDGSLETTRKLYVVFGDKPVNVCE